MCFTFAKLYAMVDCHKRATCHAEHVFQTSLFTSPRVWKLPSLRYKQLQKWDWGTKPTPSTCTENEYTKGQWCRSAQSPDNTKPSDIESSFQHKKNLLTLKKQEFNDKPGPGMANVGKPKAVVLQARQMERGRTWWPCQRKTWHQKWPVELPSMATMTSQGFQINCNKWFKSRNKNHPLNLSSAPW